MTDQTNISPVKKVKFTGQLSDDRLLLVALLLVSLTGAHDFSQESQDSPKLFVTKSLHIHIAMSRYSLKIVPYQQPQKTREWAWARLKLSFSRNVFFSLMTGAVIYKRVKLVISLKFWCLDMWSLTKSGHT